MLVHIQSSTTNSNAWYSCGPLDARSACARQDPVRPLQVIVDLWAEGADWPELAVELEGARAAQQRWLADRRGMRVLVDSVLRSLQMDEQVACIERLGFLGFQARGAHQTVLLLQCHAAWLGLPGLPGARRPPGRVVGAVACCMAGAFLGFQVSLRHERVIVSAAYCMAGACWASRRAAPTRPCDWCSGMLHGDCT